MIEGSGRPKNIPGSATLMYGFDFNLKKTSFAPDSILVNRVRIQRSPGSGSGSRRRFYNRNLKKITDYKTFSQKPLMYFFLNL
jgi:hypothetical protein